MSTLTDNQQEDGRRLVRATLRNGVLDGHRCILPPGAEGIMVDGEEWLLNPEAGIKTGDLFEEVSFDLVTDDPAFAMVESPLPADYWEPEAREIAREIAVQMMPDVDVGQLQRVILETMMRITNLNEIGEEEA